MPAHTRSSPLSQINAGNFEDLEQAWLWRTDNFGPNIDYFSRSTPIYVDGLLYTVATPRRQVVAIDPATGETIWVFREPETTRFLRSPRRAYGKGVAYGEIDGRGVIYITSPAFFLWALDAKTGRPLESWGAPVPLDDFEQTGVVDLIPHLLEGWGQWERWDEGPYDADYGVPRELGMVTASAPPIVVNGVVVVLVGHQPSHGQTRIENIPGDIMGFDARTGERLWKFHVIPRPGGVRPRDLGERRLDVVGRHVVVGSRLCRPGAGARLHRDERLDGAVVLRSSAGRQPLRRQPHRVGRPDGRAEVALPDPP